MSTFWGEQENNIMIRIIYGSCNERIIYDSYNGRIILLAAPLLVVPTELTEHTEAYGLKLFESTEWPALREARIQK